MHHNFQFIKSGDEGNDWIIFTSDKQTLKEDLHPFGNPYFQQQLKIMQWTGIENIYEGDIVELGNDGVQGIVEYDEDRFYVNCENVQTRVSKLHTVIGNIYEIAGKNYDDIIECGDKLYYEINPRSKMNVPSYFYEKLEKYYNEWRINKNGTFYDYCKNALSNTKND